MMANCYVFLGVIETVAAFMAFFWTLDDFGIRFHDSIGSGIGFRKPFHDLNEERQ